MTWRQRRDEALFTLEQPGARGDERSAAARRLRDLVDEKGFHAEAGDLCKRLLYDRQDEVRRAGLEIAIQCLPAEQLADCLPTLIADPSALVRVQVAGFLADREESSCLEQLRLLLTDSDVPVRFEAARGLAALGDASGLEVLTDALRDGDVRFRALGALAVLGDVRALPAVRALFGRVWLPPYERTQAAGVLAKLGDTEAAAFLVERTHLRRGMDRAFAIELCGEVKAPGARARLGHILADRSDAYRGAAARGLGRLGELGALPELLAVVEDASEPDELRLDAAEGCLRLVGAVRREQIAALLQTLKADWARNEARDLLELYA